MNTKIVALLTGCGNNMLKDKNMSILGKSLVLEQLAKKWCIYRLILTSATFLLEAWS
jgi:hypothetical protein